VSCSSSQAEEGHRLDDPRILQQALGLGEDADVDGHQLSVGKGLPTYGAIIVLSA